MLGNTEMGHMAQATLAASHFPPEMDLRGLPQSRNPLPLFTLVNMFWRPLKVWNVQIH